MFTYFYREGRGGTERNPPHFSAVREQECCASPAHCLRGLSVATMGAGLAAQRGWPQGQEQDPPSPHSTEGTTPAGSEKEHGSNGNSSSADLLLYEETSNRTEVQPLEDGGFAHYGSAANLTNLVPLAKNHSFIEPESGRIVDTNDNWDAAVSESDHLEQREGREMSVAYDLGAVLSTEDEVGARNDNSVLPELKAYLRQGFGDRRPSWDRHRED